MPWHIEKGGGTCKIGEFAVIKNSDGSTAGCHPTMDAARKQVAALYANDKSGGNGTKRGLATVLEEQRGLAAEYAALEIRAAGADSPVDRFHGYSAVFNSRTAIGNPKTFGFYEEIAPSAFNKTLQETDVRMLLEHNPYYVVSRISAGTLDLRADTYGLAVDSALDYNLSYVRDFAANVRNKNITGMSFGFKVVNGGDEWRKERTEDGTEFEVRRVNECALHHVTGVTFPAYEKTQAELHTVAAALRNRGDLDAIEQRAQYRPELFHLCGIDPDLRPTIIDLHSASNAAQDFANALRSGISEAEEQRVHSTETSDKPWDAAANEKRIANDASTPLLREEYAYVPGADASKSTCKFPHHFVSPDGTPGAASTVACSAGIAALNGARGGADLPSSARSAVYSHLAAHLRAAGKQAPDLNRSAEPEYTTRTDIPDHEHRDDSVEPAASTQLPGPSIADRMRALSARYHLPVG